MTDIFGKIAPVYIVNSSAGGVATTDGFLKFAWYPSTWKMDYRTRPYYGCSSTAAGGAAGTTGTTWAASTYFDLLQSTHITAPTGQGVIYYQVYTVVFNHSTAGELSVRRYPVGSTGQTIINTLTTAITNGDPMQFELPMSPGEEFTLYLSAATSTGQYTLYVDRLTV